MVKHQPTSMGIPKGAMVKHQTNSMVVRKGAMVKQLITSKKNLRLKI